MPFDERREPTEPRWAKQLREATTEGGSIVGGILAEPPQSGVTFWVSSIPELEIGRDPLGDVLLRFSGVVRMLSAREIGVLAGMLMRAAEVQAVIEADEGD